MMSASTQRGAALPAVLILASTLGLFATAFVQTARLNTVAARYDADSISLSAAADAGVQRALAAISDNDETFLERNAVKRVDMDVLSVNVAITAENGKLDLNEASLVSIQALIDEIISDNDLDVDAAFVMEGVQARRRAADDKAAFTTLTDFARVEGVTEAFYERIEPHITTFGFSPRINAVYATAPVLMATPGLTRGDVDRILTARENGRVVAIPAAAAWLTNEDPKFFQVRSVAGTDDGRVAARDVVIWKRERGGAIIVESRPAYQALAADDDAFAG